MSALESRDLEKKRGGVGRFRTGPSTQKREMLCLPSARLFNVSISTDAECRKQQCGCEDVLLDREA